MSYARSRRFARFIENFGEATSHQAVPTEMIEKYRGKLPDLLLDYWQHEGWNGYANGLLWTVNPDDYAGVLEAWLEPTSIPAIDDYYVFARSAFGDLYVWGANNNQDLVIAPALNQIVCQKCELERERHNANRAIEIFFGFATKEKFDYGAVSGKPIFDRALKRLGPCNANEMYGFVPALILGGMIDEKSVEKMNIFVQLNMLADMADERSIPSWDRVD